MLRKGNDSYYRIELPNNNEDDRHIAEGLRSVLATILQYETTACPFKRGFYVELPESPATPKRPWKPKQSPSLPSPAVSPLSQTGEAGPSLSHYPQQPTRVTMDAAESQSIAKTSAKVDSPNDNLAQLLEADSPSKDAQKRRVSQLITNIEGKTTIVGVNSSSIIRGSEAVQCTSTLSGDVSMPANVKAQEDGNDSCTLSNKTLLGERSNTRSWGENNKVLPLELRNEVSNCRGDGDGCEHESSFLDEPVTFNARNREVDRPPDSEEKDRSSSPRGFEDLAVPSIARPFTQFRSITAPSALDRTISSHRSARTQLKDADAISLASSIESLESFHSFHSPTSPLTPSPPDSQKSSPQYRQLPLDIQRTRPLKRVSLNLTATASDDDSAVDMSTPPWPGNSPITPVPRDFLPVSENRTPSPPLDQFTPCSPPRSASMSSSIRRRLPRRRPHSPLLSPANMYIPQARLSGGHLTTVILQKTCSLLLGPPVQLVALMLNIAAKLAAGSLTITTFTYDERGQAIPCSWGEDEDDGEGEDDYGISLGGTPEIRTAFSDSAQEDSNWDID